MGIWSLMKFVFAVSLLQSFPAAAYRSKAPSPPSHSKMKSASDLREWWSSKLLEVLFFFMLHLCGIKRSWNLPSFRRRVHETRGEQNGQVGLESSEFTCPSLHSGNMSSVNSLLPVYKFMVCRLKSSSHACFLQIRQQQVRADETSREKSNYSQHLAWPLATSEHSQKTSKTDPIITPKKHLACKWHCAWTWPTRKCYHLWVLSRFRIMIRVLHARTTA